MPIYSRTILEFVMVIQVFILILLLILGLAPSIGYFLPSSPAFNRYPVFRLAAQGNNADITIESTYSMRKDLLILKLSQHDISGATALVDSFNKVGRSNDCNTVIQLISDACVQSSRLDYVSGLVSRLSSTTMPRTLDDKSLNKFLTACSQNRCMNHAFDVIEVIGSKGFIIPPKVINYIVLGFGKSKNEDYIDRTLSLCHKHSVKVDLILLHAVMDSYIKCRKFYKSLKIFNVLHPRSEIYTDSWSSDVTSSRESIDYQEYLRWLQTSLLAGLQPNTRTFNIILKGLKGLPNGFWYTQDVLKDMMQSNIVPDEISINTIIDIGATSGYKEQAEKMLSSSFVAPGVEAYTAVINAYANQGHVTSALRVMESMKQRNISPNAFTWTSLISACIVDNNPALAYDILINSALKAMASSSDRAVVYGSYVGGLCTLAQNSRPMREKARLFLNAIAGLLDMDDLGYRPDVVTMNAFLQATCKIHPLGGKLGALVLQAMLLDGLQPDDYTYSILFSALGKDGAVAEALQMYRTSRFNLDTASINSLFKALAGGAEPIYALAHLFEIIGNSQQESSNNSRDSGLDKELSSQSKYKVFVPDQISFTIQYSALLRCVDDQVSSNVGSNFHEDRRSMRLERSEAYEAELREAVMRDGTFNTVDEHADFTKRLRAVALQQEHRQLLHIGKLLAAVINSGISSTRLAAVSDEESISSVVHRLLREADVSIPSTITDEALVTNAKKLVKTATPDSVLQQLYRTMRFRYSILPDEKMVRVLNSLFASSPQSYVFGFFFNGFSKETARLVFEDLAINGFSPSNLQPILEACKYSYQKYDDLLQEGETLRLLRASAVSFRIFQKHGWNSMGSGWNPI